MKLVILRHKTLTVALCLAAAALIIGFVNHPAFVGASGNVRQLPIYCVQKDYKVCALSFDAAWGNEDTEALIDIFDRYDIKVTFFVVGDWVKKYPESVRALSDAGHEIMNHSSDHAHFNSLDREQIIRDLTDCNEKIAAVTGETPTLFRPPYGEYNDRVISTVRSMGMEPVQWDVEASHTAASPSASQLFHASKTRHASPKKHGVFFCAKATPHKERLTALRGVALSVLRPAL